MTEIKIDYSLLLNIIAIVVNPLINWWTNYQRKIPSITHRIIKKQAEKEKEKLKSEYRIDQEKKRAELKLKIIALDLNTLKKIAIAENDKTKVALQTVEKEFLSKVETKTANLIQKFQNKVKVGKERINSFFDKDKSPKSE